MTGPKDYGKRLGIISVERFQEALERLKLGDFVSAEAITLGLFGQNLFLTSTKGEFVLRGCPHYPWQFPTEQFFSRLLRERTQVPVPWPYLLHESSDIFGWSFVIMPRMPGLQLADERVVAKLTLEDRRGISRAMARALLEIQGLTWSYAGRYDVATTTVKPL